MLPIFIRSVYLKVLPVNSDVRDCVVIKPSTLVLMDLQMCNQFYK